MPARTAIGMAALRRDVHLLVSGGGKTRLASFLHANLSVNWRPSRSRASIAGLPNDAPLINVTRAGRVHLTFVKDSPAPAREAIRATTYVKNRVNARGAFYRGFSVTAELED